MNSRRLQPKTKLHPTVIDDIYIAIRSRFWTHHMLAHITSAMQVENPHTAQQQSVSNK
jgi:hypothetical protein